MKLTPLQIQRVLSGMAPEFHPGKRQPTLFIGYHAEQLERFLNPPAKPGRPSKRYLEDRNQRIMFQGY